MQTTAAGDLPKYSSVTMHHNKRKSESRKILKYLVLAFVLFVIYYFAVKPSPEAQKKPDNKMEEEMVRTEPDADVALTWLKSVLKKDNMRCSELLSDKLALDIYTIYLHKLAKHLGSADSLRNVYADSDKERELIKFSLASDPNVRDVCITDMHAATKLMPWLLGGKARIHVLDTTDGAAYERHLRPIKKQFPYRVNHIIVDPTDVAHSLRYHDLSCGILVIDSQAPKYYSIFLNSIASLSVGQVTVLMEEFEFDTLLHKEWTDFRERIVSQEYFRCSFRGEQKAGIFFEKVLQEAPVLKAPAFRSGGL